MKKKMCECGSCESCSGGSKAMPGFGGTLRNSGNMMPSMGNENPNAGEIQFVPVTFDTPEKLREFVKEIIRKVGGHYELKSHSGKTLGKGTKGEMEDRERQVNYFKNKGK
jgi:hypothetical protein